MTTINQALASSVNTEAAGQMSQANTSTQFTVQATAMAVSMLPIMCVYPFCRNICAGNDDWSCKRIKIKTNKEEGSMKFRRATAIVLSLAMAFSLTACGGTEKAQGTASAESSESQASGEVQEKAEENIPTLTLFVDETWWPYDKWEGAVPEEFERRLGVKVEVTRAADDNQLALMVASGDMPDIIPFSMPAQVVAQKADTWAYALQDLADNYDPYFYKVASAQTLSWFAMDDGKTYGYPDYSNTQEDYDSGEIYAKTAFVIRNDVYEALGKPSMGTQEEFLDV